MEFHRAKRTACVNTLLPTVMSDFLLIAVPRKQIKNCFLTAYNLRYKKRKII